MKRFTLFIALGLAATEKLDRTYLPPPGSKYAGGEPGDLQVPLEFPKQAYTTTSPLLPGQNVNGPPSVQDTRLVPGLFRGPGQDFLGTTSVTPANKQPFNYFQSKVPTTTTSYAFTQTTTFPSSESYETTINPIFPTEAQLSDQPGFVNQPFSQGQIFNQQTGQNLPSFVKPTNQLSQRPGFLPISNISGVQALPGSQTTDGRPIYTQAQNINQNQQNGPVSTVYPGSNLQPGLVATPPYTQHLGVQPPRQFNQQGYIPSSTAAPDYQTSLPFQHNSDVSNVQTSTVNGQQPSGYPINGAQRYFPSSTAGPNYQTKFPTQNNGDTSNVQSTKGSEQQPSGYPTNRPQGYFQSSIDSTGYQTGLSPQNNGDTLNIQTTKISDQRPSGYPISGPQQSTTQYIDKYGNVQSNPSSGFNIPPQIQQGQSLAQPGLSQYGGDSNSGIPGSIISQQGTQNLQSGAQGSLLPHEGSNTGLSPGQQQQMARPQYFNQKGPFVTSTSFQDNDAPRNFLNQQQGPGEVTSTQGYQYPQPVNQQNVVPSSEVSQSTQISGPSLSQSQRTQAPEFNTQQNFYPSPESAFKLNSETVSQGAQPTQQQLTVQQSLYPTTLTPGQIGINQQGQFIGQPGDIPSQYSYQQPGYKKPQTIGQQNSFPNIGTIQEGIPGQTYSQQTQLSPQSYQTTNRAPSKQGNNINNVPQGSKAPGQMQIIENFPGSGPFRQPHVPNVNIPSKQPTPGDQRIDRPGTAAVPSGYQQPYYTSTTPSSIPSYVTSPVGEFSSTTPPLIGNDLRGRRPGTNAVPSGYQQPYYTSTTPSSIPSYVTTPGGVYSSTTSPLLGNDVRGRRPGSIISRPERPQAESDRNAVILNYDNVLTPDGFAYSFDTSNGIHADENGTAIDGVKADGSYSYIGDDGKLYSIVYTADENGFRPRGDHLPTPPPVPKAIQQVIEQATKDKEAGISHDGFYDDKKYGHKKYQYPKHGRPETLDKVVNGADVNEEYETGNKNRDYNKKTIPYEKESSDKHDYNGYNTDDDIIMMDKRNELSRRPYNKIPGQIAYEIEQEHDDIIGKQPQITRQESERTRPFDQDKGSHRHRPGTFSHKGKPVFSEEQYDSRQEYNDKDIPEEEFVIRPNGSDKKILSKTTGTKYSVFGRDSQQNNEDELQIPGQFKTSKPSVNKVMKGSKRPILHDTQPVEKLHDHKQTIGKASRPEKPINDSLKTLGSVGDDGFSNQDDYQEPALYDQENQDGRGAIKMRPSYNRNQFTYKQKPSINNQKGKYDIDYPTDIRSEENGQTYKDIPEDTDDEEIGYQYNPPQNKLHQKEKNRFPSRLSDKEMTKIPSYRYETSDKRPTVQPFITPNVHRDENGSYEDASEEKTRKMTTNVPEYTTTEDNSEYIDEKSVLEQQYDEGNDTSIKTRPTKPGKTISVQRPGYKSQPTTEKPEHYYDENATEKRGKMPRPASDRYPSDFGKQSTLGEPEQEYSDETEETSRSPNTYISSTTPMPSKKPYRPSYKQTSPQGPTQHSSTYKPSDTSTTEEDYYEGAIQPGYTSSKSSSRRPTTSSTRVSNITPSTVKDRPGTSRTKIVSSRPTYDYNTDVTITPESPTIRPGIAESTFSKPSVRPGGSRRPSYSTTTPQTNEPDYNKDYDSETPDAGSFYSVQDGPNYPEKSIKESETPVSSISQNLGQPGRKDVPSTTYRPNYSITTISQPGLVAVDTFGRPVPESGILQPAVTIPANQGTSNVYQDTGNNRQGPDQVTFKPNEPRFGGPVIGIPGQKPAEFGPSSFTTPGYLGPYGPSTGTIIGEDFSGPKQQQKYDPETGYYY